MTVPGDWEEELVKSLAEQDITEHPILPRHFRRIQDLPAYHRDPFDRTLIAQALESELAVIGSDTQFDSY